MKKILTLGINLNPNHKARLEKVGILEIKEAPKSSDELINMSSGIDVLFSNGDFLLESLPKLKNMLVVYPFVEIGSFDSKELKNNGVLVANSKGGNRDSIVEWVMYMVISLFRNFRPFVRAEKNIPFVLHESLKDKNVLIIGHGSIGTQIGILCQAFGMKAEFFDRGDSLIEKSKSVDLVINALNCNPTNKNLLDEKFFMSLQKGSYYATFVRPYTYDIDGLIKSISAGIVAGAAIDCDPEGFGDTSNEFYKKAMGNDKILVTPHIAFSTKQAIFNGAEIAIENIESYLAGTPKNIVEK